MPDIRPAASLTSGLLARRGDARPAMRRQQIGHLHMPLAPQDDLGWNDIGDDQGHLPPVTSLSAMTPLGGPQVEPSAHEEDAADAEEPVAAPVVPPTISPLTHHLEAIAQRINQAPRPESVFRPMIERSATVSRSAPKPNAAADRKAAFTLRIDPERHLRLRLLSALVNRSSQQLLIEALDALLAAHEKVEDLAGQVENNAELREANGF